MIPEISSRLSKLKPGNSSRFEMLQNAKLVDHLQSLCPWSATNGKRLKTSINRRITTTTPAFGPFDDPVCPLLQCGFPNFVHITGIAPAVQGKQSRKGILSTSCPQMRPKKRPPFWWSNLLQYEKPTFWEMENGHPKMNSKRRSW